MFRHFLDCSLLVYSSFVQSYSDVWHGFVLLIGAYYIREYDEIINDIIYHLVELSIQKPLFSS